MKEVEQLGAVRSLTPEPLVLIGKGVLAVQDFRLERLELRVAPLRHREAVHAQSVELARPGRVVRRPRPVIRRGGGRDLDVVRADEARRDDARVALGAADDLVAEALDDDEDVAHRRLCVRGTYEIRVR